MRALARHNGCRSARLESARDMIVTIMRIALDGDEQVAHRQNPAVDRDAIDSGTQRVARKRAKRRDQIRLGSRASLRCLPERRARLICVGERQDRVADDLARFVTLAGDQQRSPS